MESMKNHLSNVLHDYAESNEGANLKIYETLDDVDLLLRLRWVRKARACWPGSAQATLREISNNHLNGSDRSEGLSRSKTVNFHDDVAV